MKKVTLIFPGQGAQYVGMGKGLYTSELAVKRVFDQADDVLHFPLSKLCFEGPENDLKATYNTQVALLTHSFALFQLWKEKIESRNCKIDAVCGHSVGEYAALCAAESIDFATALNLTRNRGKYMQESVPIGVGKMAAILMVDAEVVAKACQEATEENSVVAPANFNSPQQIVISGHKEAVDRAISVLEKMLGRVRAVELAVSAPFHCSLMKPAAFNLKKHLDQAAIKSLKIPYIANVDARKYNCETDPEIIRENLFRQIESCVLWTQSIMNADQDSLFIEMGPGKVLKGLLKKINSELKVISVEEENALEEFDRWSRL